MLYIRCMIRTQIYLPKDLYRNIDIAAKRERKAKAAVIREVLEEGFAQKQGNAGKALLRLAKMAVKGGPPDLSANIDKYLYEDK